MRPGLWRACRSVINGQRAAPLSFVAGACVSVTVLTADDVEFPAEQIVPYMYRGPTQILRARPVRKAPVTMLADRAAALPSSDLAFEAALAEHAVEQRAVDEDHVAYVDAAHEHVQRHRATRMRSKYMLHDVLDVGGAVEAAKQRRAASRRKHEVTMQREDLLLLAKRRLDAVEDVWRHLCAQGVCGVLHLAADVAPALLMLRLTATNP